MRVANSDNGNKNTENFEKHENSSPIRDLQNKVMEVGGQKFFIDMKESSHSRFFKIVEVLSRFQRSRLVVPMTAATEFCQKLQEIDNFAKNYDPTAFKQKGEKTQEGFLHSVSFATPGRRRYYFDLQEGSEYNFLRVSYVFGDRRDNVRIPADAIEEILNILNSFIENYPPLPGQEEEESHIRPPVSGSRRNFDRNRRYNQQGGYVPRQVNGRSQNDLVHRQQSQTTPLKVLDDPSPAVVDLSPKSYCFEVVRGKNMYLRITEIVNGNRKSTMHVPAEGCSKIKSVIDDFVVKIDLLNAANPVAPATTS